MLTCIFCPKRIRRHGDNRTHCTFSFYESHRNGRQRKNGIVSNLAVLFGTWLNICRLHFVVRIEQSEMPCCGQESFHSPQSIVHCSLFRNHPNLPYAQSIVSILCGTSMRLSYRKDIKWPEIMSPLCSKVHQIIRESGILIVI